MTAAEVIAAVDALEPNAFSTEQKLRWLWVLDGQIYDELVRTHRQAEPTEPPEPYEDGTEELLVPSPYGEEIYNRWLQAMMAAENDEAAKYTRQMQMYNAAYRSYVNFTNRSIPPRAARGGNRLRF